MSDVSAEKIESRKQSILDMFRKHNEMMYKRTFGPDIPADYVSTFDHVEAIESELVEKMALLELVAEGILNIGIRREDFGVVENTVYRVSLTDYGRNVVK